LKIRKDTHVTEKERNASKDRSSRKFQDIKPVRKEYEANSGYFESISAIVNTRKDMNFCLSGILSRHSSPALWKAYPGNHACHDSCLAVQIQIGKICAHLEKIYT